MTEKVFYLRNYREGDAAAPTAGLPGPETGYESATQFLKGMFGDMSRIIQRDFRNLRELQYVTSLSREKKLLRLCPGIQLNIRTLRVLDVPTDIFSEMFYIL